MMYILVALFGVLVGSFCNVCIVRIPKDEGVVMGFSHCTSCNKRLVWWELVPVVSWVLLKGKCYGCKSRISIQYPLVELFNGLIWVVIVYYIGFNIEALLGCMLVSTLLVISIIDAKTMIIPIETTVFIGILGIIYSMFNISNWREHLLGFFCISTILLLIFIISKGTAIGGGDVKLMAGAGLYLGLVGTLIAFFTACLLGSIIHPIRMKLFGVNNRLAMGPYLSIGIGISLIWGTLLTDWYFLALFG
ncbi:MAG: hypothetical protein BEN18_06825 [Epulopiscium sp. Nuni2H_MBin001]|nr:MAG: hypothetical protein BEN18_06825 [Epulopiscium sp. Nuni2H_MBin001]